MPMSEESGRPESLHLCLHMPQFPAQALAALSPELRKKPFVVVRQSADSHRSSIWSCSMAAVHMGIEAGTPVFVLRRTMPAVPVLFRDRAAETHATGALAAVMDRHSPIFQQGRQGIVMVDLTGTPAQRGGSPGSFGRQLLQEVACAAGVEAVAAGISSSRLVAYLMAISSEPGLVSVCAPGDEADALIDIEVQKLPALSRRCRAGLRRYGLTRVGQVQAIGRAALARRFEAEGERLFALARGIGWNGETAVDRNGDRGASGRDRRSGTLEVETILDRDVIDSGTLDQTVRYTADKACHELRAMGRSLVTMTMVLRYSDGVRRQRSFALARPTQAFEDVAAAAVDLFREMNERRIAIKSISIRGGRMQPESGQGDLFDGGGEAKRRALGRSIASIRQRSGFGAILSAATLPVYKSDPAETGGGQQPGRR